MSATPQFLRVRNWDKFQHYKDRDPTWIKLYLSLLDDVAIDQLGDAKFGQLVKLWLYAARRGNSIPFDNKSVGRRIGARGLRLEFFVELGLLEPTKKQPTKKGERAWPSRYISRPVRALVLERDDHRCVRCGSNLWLEIDHIVPVSKGGEGTPDNLQTLCRSCNRSKRNRGASAEQPATQKRDPRSLEAEGEKETEGLSKKAVLATPREAAEERQDEKRFALRKLVASLEGADDRTEAVLWRYARLVPVGAIHKVAESSAGKGPGYACRALQSELRESA